MYSEDVLVTIPHAFPSLAAPSICKLLAKRYVYLLFISESVSPLYLNSSSPSEPTLADLMAEDMDAPSQYVFDSPPSTLTQQ